MAPFLIRYAVLSRLRSGSSRLIDITVAVLLPESLRLNYGIYAVVLPPRFLSAIIVKRPVMKEAQRHRPFATDLTPHGPWLRKSEVVSMARCTATNEARQ